VVIVDGGSSDKTIERIKNYESEMKKRRIKFKLVIKKGNRSVGRNEAIKIASNNIIACSDAGNILDKNWLQNISKNLSNPKVEVVAGYYKGLPRNIFEKCLIPYVLVMEDKINSEDFLPATRSVAFRKELWEKVGGFDNNLSNNEDYAFAIKLKKTNAKIVFAKSALVYWRPRKNIKEAFIMFYRFAFGDAESRILRPKVILVFLRYFVGIAFLFLYLITENKTIYFSIIVLLVFYVVWSIRKNYKYVNDARAFFYLPLIQFTSDIAVLFGTSIGFIKDFSVKKIGKVRRFRL